MSVEQHQHLVHIPVTLEVANRVRAYAVELSCTMQDALEIIVERYDETVGKPADLDAPSSVTQLAGATPMVNVRTRRNEIAHGLRAQIPESAPPTRQFFRTSRGVHLPVGLQMNASYRSNLVWATVEKFGIRYDGQLYPDPSAAAVAVKQSFGLSLSSAQTNGWTFWGYMIEGRGESLNRFRENAEVAIEEYFVYLYRPGGMVSEDQIRI